MEFSQEQQLEFEKYVEKAYKVIQTMYKNEKSKKFIIHLIHSFLPIQSFNIVYSKKTVCAITKQKGFDVNEFFELTKNSLFIRAKTMVGTDEEKEEAKRELKFMNENVKEAFNAQDNEPIMITRKMYFSEKSDVHLSMPSIIALRNFVMEQSLMRNQEIIGIGFNKFKKNNNSKKTQIQNISKPVEIYDLPKTTLSDVNSNVFEQLKKTFK